MRMFGLASFRFLVASTSHRTARLRALALVIGPGTYVRWFLPLKTPTCTHGLMFSTAWTMTRTTSRSMETPLLGFAASGDGADVDAAPLLLLLLLLLLPVSGCLGVSGCLPADGDAL